MRVTREGTTRTAVVHELGDSEQRSLREPTPDGTLRIAQGPHGLTEQVLGAETFSHATRLDHGITPRDS